MSDKEMYLPRSCMIEKELLYSSRVLVGRWQEKMQLQDYKMQQFLKNMVTGDVILAKYRKMTEQLNSAAYLTQTTGPFPFGSTICLYAPYAPASHPPVAGKKGIFLGGRVSVEEIMYSQDLEDRSSVVGVPLKKPAERNAFVICSTNYCNKDDENVTYNQEFLLALSSSRKRDKPLYLRYDPDPIPGLNGNYPLYLSKHPVSCTRWCFLPTRKPNITRFEEEGTPVQVNTDVIVNHVATNINLGLKIGVWSAGFDTGTKVGIQNKARKMQQLWYKVAASSWLC